MQYEQYNILHDIYKILSIIYYRIIYDIIIY